MGSIESRLLGWFSCCTRINNTFRAGLDTYKEFATHLYGVPYDEVTKEQRFFCKPIILGAGYRLGWEGLIAYADSMGVTMTDEEAKHSIQAYRETYPEVVRMWYGLEEMLLACVVTGLDQTGYSVRMTKYLDMLAIILPSGRAIHYHKPEIRNMEMPWSTPEKPAFRDCFTAMGENRFTHQWQRQAMHGGWITENCIAAGTLVLTDSGWKEIQNIDKFDLVHDGIDFVSHGGRVFKSVQPCVTVDGLYMTADHEVLTDAGWKTASTNPNPYRPNLRGVNLCRSRPERQTKTKLGVPVRLWDALYSYRNRCKKAGKEWWGSKLRVFDYISNQKSQYYARHDSSPCVLGVEVYAVPVSKTDTSSMEKLRRKGYICLQSVAAFFREFLDGYEQNLSDRVNPGAREQQRKLLPKKLYMGLPQKTSKQHPSKHSDSNTGRGANCSSSSENVRNRKLHYSLSDSSEVAGRQTSDTPEFPKQRVYDLVNCGPRHRFVVKGTTGAFIVHNCVQAFARDVMGIWMLRADAADFSIVLHAHDELACEEDSDRLEELQNLIRQPIDWAPGLLLDASGYVAQRYRK